MKKLFAITLVLCFVSVGMGQEAELNWHHHPKPNCNITLEYFNGLLISYFDEELQRTKYCAYLQWRIEKKREDGGEWQLMKVNYKIDKDTGNVIDAWKKKFYVLKTPFFDGRLLNHFHEDFDIAKNTIVIYMLRWRCGYCSEWEYYGSKRFQVPRK